MASMCRVYVFYLVKKTRHNTITVSRQNTTTGNGLAKEFGHLELKKYFLLR